VYPFSAVAESYVVGEVGLTVPQSLHNVRQTTGAEAGANITDEDLKDSVMIGGKLGYFFDRLPWLGLYSFSSFPVLFLEVKLTSA